mmetsp:Transcript_92972/g.240689  ORF Transcript_92972/g.240689 Transcript_92972/m.240689 type:complete len:206 (+) Transcript_92972:392-1009(+)
MHVQSWMWVPIATPPSCTSKHNVASAAQRIFPLSPAGTMNCMLRCPTSHSQSWTRVPSLEEPSATSRHILGKVAHRICPTPPMGSKNCMSAWPGMHSQSCRTLPFCGCPPPTSKHKPGLVAQRIDAGLGIPAICWLKAASAAANSSPPKHTSKTQLRNTMLPLSLPPAPRPLHRASALARRASGQSSRVSPCCASNAGPSKTTCR